MEKFFKLKENGTTVRTEVLAGLTTFMTMAYIIALNPNLLTGFDVGSPLWNGVFMATCIASAIGTICMAIYANKPFAMAPGMGLNSFFAVVVTNIVAITGSTYVESFQAALCIILIEGIIFIILSVLNVREKIVQAIPLGIRLGIAPSIGLMLVPRPSPLRAAPSCNRRSSSAGPSAARAPRSCPDGCWRKAPPPLRRRCTKRWIICRIVFSRIERR